eukprot:m.61174 g.61174  ORF g.61174 m.61174 type:complete len:319 (+) comp11379_c0_seq12:1016-1972(+)
MAYLAQLRRATETDENLCNPFANMHYLDSSAHMVLNMSSSSSTTRKKKISTSSSSPLRASSSGHMPTSHHKLNNVSNSSYNAPPVPPRRKSLTLDGSDDGLEFDDNVGYETPTRTAAVRPSVHLYESTVFPPTSTNANDRDWMKMNSQASDAAFTQQQQQQHVRGGSHLETGFLNQSQEDEHEYVEATPHPTRTSQPPTTPSLSSTVVGTSLPPPPPHSHPLSSTSSSANGTRFRVTLAGWMERKWTPPAFGGIDSAAFPCNLLPFDAGSSNCIKNTPTTAGKFLTPRFVCFVRFCRDQRSLLDSAVTVVIPPVCATV